MDDLDVVRPIRDDPAMAHDRVAERAQPGPVTPLRTDVATDRAR
jgi:hypothetical protein